MREEVRSDGWVIAQLGEIGDEVRGSVRPKPSRKYEIYSVPAFPLNKPEIIDGSEIGSSKRPVEPGDILICKINPRINRVWIVGQRKEANPQIASTEWLVLRLHEAVGGVSHRYVMWYLRSPEFRQWIELNVEGATGSHTRAKSPSILRQEIPLAPAPAQDRIVEAIEERFSRLDHSDSLLRDARQRSLALEQAIINAATEGYRTRPLADLIREPLRNGHSAKRSSGGKIPVFTLTAVTARDFSDRNTKLTDADPRRVEELWVEPGDLFVERSNTPELVGTAALYSGPSKRAVFPDLLIRVRFGAEILPEYAELGLRSSRARRYFQRMAKGIAGSMPKVDQAAVLAVELPVPSLVEQRKIVEQYDDHVVTVRSVIETCTRALLRTAHLRRSILERAFAGDLIERAGEEAVIGRVTGGRLGA